MNDESVNNSKKSGGIIHDIANIPQTLTSSLIGIVDGATDVRDRYRSLQLLINNHTQQTLVFADCYFESGCSVTDPAAHIGPGQTTTCLVANSQGSFLTGVTGGFKYSIYGRNMALYIGFCNPAIGSYKHYGAVLQDCFEAKCGYDNCRSDGMTNSKQNGYLVTVQKKQSTVAHRQIVYTIAKSN